MEDADVSRMMEAYASEKRKDQAIIQQQAIAQSTSDLANVQRVEESNQRNVSTIKEQLDLTDEITRIDYLLRGYNWGINDNGKPSWIAPKSDEERTLSDYGVAVIRQMIGWYINKNTLLSHFPEMKMIEEKMKLLGHAINNKILMEYEKIFQHPSLETCKKELIRRVNKRVGIRIFALELIGKKVDENNIAKEFLQELEGKVEQELEKIRVKLMQDKYKSFELLLTQILDCVHATMLRAYKGEERNSIRRHSNIMEFRNDGNMAGDNISNYKGAMGLLKK